MYTFRKKGFPRTLFVIALVVIIGSALSVTFINNLTKRNHVSEISKINEDAQTSEQENENNLKTYTSISGSGLTFDYPSNWYFEEPSEQQISREDSKATLMMLYSHKPDVVDGKGSISTSNICVTFNEMQGNWPFRSQPLGDSDTIASFSINQNPVSVVENKANLTAAVSPAMQIINRDESSEHGGAYVALDNNYFLLATASKDCWISDTASDKDISKEIKQAREILKSVRVI